MNTRLSDRSGWNCDVSLMRALAVIDQRALQSRRHLLARARPHIYNTRLGSARHARRENICSFY